MKHLLYLTFIMSIVVAYNTYSQPLKIRSDKFIHIGKEDASNNNYSLIFGKGNGTTNNGKWGIEYYNDGLNFFKAWPTTNSGNYFLYLKDNWGVGIGTNNPQSKLHVEGDICYTGILWKYSDINLKKDILPLDNNLHGLLGLSTIIYKNKHLIQTEEELLDGMRKEDLSEVQYQTLLATIERQKEAASRDTAKQYGFIAQEIEKIFPELVSKNEAGYLRVDYIGMIPVLVNAIKELNSKIETLDSRNKDAEKQFILPTKAILYQNAPNPFGKSTEIKYFIPNDVNTANICIYDLTGLQLLKIELKEKGNSSITLNAKQLKAGIYLYALIVDDTEIDTKKMIITD